MVEQGTIDMLLIKNVDASAVMVTALSAPRDAMTLVAVLFVVVSVLAVAVPVSRFASAVQCEFEHRLSMHSSFQCKHIFINKSTVNKYISNKTFCTAKARCIRVQKQKLLGGGKRNI